MYAFSPSTGGFYLPAIHGAAIPPDAVEITGEEHAALLAGQASGKEIVPGEDGQPVLQAPAEAPPAPPSRIITPRQFMDRLPMPRQQAITAAAVSSPQILLWLIRLTGALEVDLDNAETMEGVQALAIAEVITEAEAEALLA